MAVFNEPTKWASTLGAEADRVTIPDTADDTEPSIDKIFPSVFSIPLQKGGRAIPRTVLNGLFKTVGDWSYYQQNGGIASYNADFDYAVGRLVSYNGGLFKCIQDNAHTDPHDPTDKDFWAELADSVDVDNIATDLNGKADTDFSNVTDSAKVMMAKALVPSGDTTVLTVGPSSSDVTAPATGWFYMWGKASSAVPLQFVLTNMAGNCAVTDFNDMGYGLGLIMPVKAGHKVRYNYGTNATSVNLWFIKATGSVNE